jgi:hypothetical protein
MDPSSIIRNIERHVVEQASKASRDVAMDGQRKMVQAAPVKTGLLRSRITSAQEKKGQRITVRWTADTPYAAAQDQGYQNRQGRIVRFVNHPGGGGAGYMSRTFASNVRAWQQYVANKMRASS